MKIHLYYIYILTNERHTVLYTGVTNNINRRCREHQEGLIPGFTQKYNVKKLVYYEVCDLITMAIAREKQIKSITRAKKEALINKFNPEWKELYLDGRVFRPSDLR